MQYALVKNGKVQNVIVADHQFIQSIAAEWDRIEALDTLAEQNLNIGIDWSWDSVTGFTPPVVPVVEVSPQAAPKRQITQLAFLNRFTDAEAIAIDLASQGTTVEAAAMRRYQKKVDAATYIDLSRQDTRDGVLALESIGLLAAGRATEILDAPVQPEEVARG